MLIVKEVTKRFGSFTVLEGINLEFRRGVYGLLAPNGAGKTTLIKMLTTLLFPTMGEILYDGENIGHLGESYRGILGYLPQEFGYYKHYSARQFLLYIAALKGLSPTVAREKTDQLLDQVGLGEVKDKKLKKFSGGMIQRVGIAQAMLNDPQVLILDEPTAGLDPKERVRFRNLITDLARDRIIILSTHIVSDVEAIANEIIMIKDRQVLYQHPIEEITRLLAGKVYEVSVPFDEIEEIRKQYLTLGEKQEGGAMQVRLICEEKPQNHWKQVNPGLEDVFLYVYQDQGGLMP